MNKEGWAAVILMSLGVLIFASVAVVLLRAVAAARRWERDRVENPGLGR